MAKRGTGIGLPIHTVNACPQCNGGRTVMPRATWHCICGAQGAGMRVKLASSPGVLSGTQANTNKEPIYVCKWDAGTSEEHEHGAFGVKHCKVCGRCATCGLMKEYHTRGGTDDCINALAKRINELEALTSVIQMVAGSVTCRCGRPAVEHECEDCHGV